MMPSSARTSSTRHREVALPVGDGEPRGTGAAGEALAGEATAALAEAPHRERVQVARDHEHPDAERAGLRGREGEDRELAGEVRTATAHHVPEIVAVAHAVGDVALLLVELVALLRGARLDEPAGRDALALAELEVGAAEAPLGHRSEGVAVAQRLEEGGTLAEQAAALGRRVPAALHPVEAGVERADDGEGLLGGLGILDQSADGAGRFERAELPGIHDLLLYLPISKLQKGR